MSSSARDADDNIKNTGRNVSRQENPIMTIFLSIQSEIYCGNLPPLPVRNCVAFNGNIFHF